MSCIRTAGLQGKMQAVPAKNESGGTAYTKKLHKIRRRTQSVPETGRRSHDDFAQKQQASVCAKLPNFLPVYHFIFAKERRKMI